MDKIDTFKHDVIEKMGLNSFISCFSRHELIARDFCWRHPITKYLPSDYIDSNGCLASDKDVNVLLFGFGKKGQQIMKAMVLNNQFPSIKDGEYTNHKVNYYAFDKDAQSLNNPLFNEMYRELNGKDTRVDAEGLCNFKYINMDVFESKFDEDGKDVYDIINPLFSDKNAQNIVIVTLDDDIANLSFIKSIKNNIECNNVHFFAYVAHPLASVDDDVIGFGSNGTLYSHESIINNAHRNMAMQVHALYSNLHDLTHQDLVARWERLDTIDQFSNIYSTLNIRFKLNLMGLDLGYNEGLSQEEYYQALFSNDISRKDDLIQYNDYDEYFHISLRNTLAYQEHLRWCAYYVLNGYTTMPLDKITLVGGKCTTKNKAKKQHCCLTTFKALDTFHKRVATLQNCDVKSVETYKYDLMVMDNLHSVISNLSFDDGSQLNIVRK